MNYRIRAPWLLLTCMAVTAHADVPDMCRVVYRDAGAIPFDEQCFVYAASAGVDLRTYQCTARPEYVTEYCNTLPPYDEGTEDDGDNDGEEEEGDTGGSTDGDGGDSAGVDGGGTDTSGDGGTGSDGGQTGGNSDNGLTDEELTDGSGTDGGQTDAEDPEYIIGGTDTSGDSGLPTFEESPTDDGSDGSGGSSGCPAPGSQLQGSNGAIDFAFTQGWQFLDGSLSHYGDVATLVTLVNLGRGVDHARQTGDSSQMFQSIYGIVLPLFPSEGPASAVFQDFSNLVDTLGGSECK